MKQEQIQKGHVKTSIAKRNAENVETVEPVSRDETGLDESTTELLTAIDEVLGGK